MVRYNEWFAVDVKKRAATVRSRALAVILKELLANSLDAGAADITISCKPAQGTKRDSAGLRAFQVACVDDGSGCAEPDILRRVGSSTSDLYAETRGRFGQGLIDVLAICEESEIRTLSHRLVFGTAGCKISVIRKQVDGMTIIATLRHDGDGVEELDAYFDSIVLPDGVTVTLNGRLLTPRQPQRVIPEIKLQTVIYDPRAERVRRRQRATSVEIYTQHGKTPMIHELGIPVDAAPWALPFDINVLQKTPLDTDRNLLPDTYKNNLISQLIEPMSAEYAAYMNDRNEAPPEIKNDRRNAKQLTDTAQRSLVKTVIGVDRESIIRRNPLDSDDTSESQELENMGYAPVNRGTLPSGVSEVLSNAPTVADLHDELCKPTTRTDRDFPPQTDRQRQCMLFYQEIAAMLVGKPVRCDRIRGGATATWRNGVISLNVDIQHLWEDPMGEQSLGVILHECAHAKVSGHSIGFTNEVERLGGRLAVWVGENGHRWAEFGKSLNSMMLRSMVPNG